MASCGRATRTLSLFTFVFGLSLTSVLVVSPTLWNLQNNPTLQLEQETQTRTRTNRSSQQPPSSSSSLLSETRTTRHVLLALSGNHSGFLNEFEVTLKSILLHSPSDPLTIHIMADGPAYDALDDILYAKANLTNWKTRRPLKIATYNLQSRQEEWLRRIESRTAVAAKLSKFSLFRHTIGAYYRLFAGDVLPPDVDTVVYIDTDTVILASLDDIWQRQLVNETNITKKLYYWGEQRCSAFMILRPHEMERVWDLYSQVPVETLQQVLSPRPVVDDQFLLQVVHRTFPEVVGKLSPEWDISAQDGPWKYGKPHLLLPHRPKAGMLHFNGGGESKDAYFKTNKYYSKDRLWGLAKYYVELPWTWAQFVVESQVKEGQGYPVVVDYRKKILS
jgi:hypothetical protein